MIYRYQTIEKHSNKGKSKESLLYCVGQCFGQCISPYISHWVSKLRGEKHACILPSGFHMAILPHGVLSCHT